MIAFLGPEGSYGHMLAGLYFGEEEVAERGVVCQDNVGVVLAIASGQAQFGVVPVENTTGGSVVPVLDALWVARQEEQLVCLIGERTMAITHSLIGLAEVAPKQIKRIYSHHQALAQCLRYRYSIGNPETVATDSTSGAVKMVAQGRDPLVAAIGSIVSARRYGGKVLASGIEDEKGNRTRFLILGKTSAPPTGYDKTIVMFTTDPDQAGTLVDALQVLKAFKLSLDMVDTIPQPTVNGRREYRFYAEFFGHVYEDNVAAAIRAMRMWTRTLHVIGSFAASDEIIA